MLRLSTGLRNGALNNTGIREALANGVIRIYSGAQPAKADDAVAGTLLLEVTVDGGDFNHGVEDYGLEFDAPVDGVLSKAVAEVWRGTGLANGTAGWFRFYGNALDDGGPSTSLPRIDGSVGRSGADLILSNTSISDGVPQTVDAFNIAMPQS